MKNQFEYLKKDFPILHRELNDYPLCYVDNAATTQMPQQVLDAINKYYTTHHATVHRSSHTLGEEATAAYEAVREKVAQFIGAHDQSEIVFTSGTTAGINCIASRWGADKYDEILVTALEHHSNLLPWQRLAKKTGATLRFIPVKSDGTLDLNQEGLFTPHTKIIAVTGSSNAIGTQVDLRSIIDKAHAVGARVVVDAAQMVAHQKINVAELGADALVFSGHKMFGPTGVGVLYIRKEHLQYGSPCLVGGGMVHTAQIHKSTYLPAPLGLEAGTPPTAQVIGLGAAIDYLEQHIDFEQLKEHEASLCRELINRLSHLPSVKILGPIEQLKESGHLVSFTVDGVHAHDVAAHLDAYGICARAGHHCAQPLARALGYEASTRISFSVYNTLADVDRILAAISELTS